jgi:hypothetical protein
MLDKFDLTPQDMEVVKERMARISDMIEKEPKSMNWKMRAKIGEKKAWYMLPDDMAE